MKIENSKQYTDDLKRYNNALEQISSNAVKDELKSLINDLSSEVRKLDFHHQDTIINNSVLLSVNETRSNIFTIRSQIENIVKSSF